MMAYLGKMGSSIEQVWDRQMRIVKRKAVAVGPQCA